jgi:hypothetical protein
MATSLRLSTAVPGRAYTSETPWALARTSASAWSKKKRIALELLAAARMR